jgi:hypothetical protein
MLASGMQIARKLLPLLVFTASLQVHAGSEKKPDVVPPDVLARIRGAHTIFVSNAGEDDNLRNWTGYGYRAMYQALAGWPGIQLVDSPAHADLVFQVSATESIDDYSGSPFPSKGHPTGNVTVEATVTLDLSVLDPVTQQLIWDNQADEDPSVMGNAYTRGVKSVLAPIEPTKPAPHPVKKPALLPAQLKNPAKLFLQMVPSPANSDVSDADTAVSQALLKLGRYTLVGSAKEADVVLLLDVVANTGLPPLSYMRVEVLDPGSKTFLWSFTIAFANDNRMTAQQQINEIIPYFLKAWNGVIGKDHI